MRSCRISVDVPAVIPLAWTADLLPVGIRVGILSAVRAYTARRGLYALAPFALAWTVATPYLFAGQQMQVGRTLTVAFAMVVAAVFLFFRYDVHITSARVRKAIIWLAGYSYTIYLVHSPLSKVLIGPRIPAPTDGWSYAGISVLMFGATLLAALLFAVIADTVVLKPVQRLLRKVRL